MGQFSIVNSFITVISPLEPWAPTVVTTIFIFRFGFYFARHHEYESPRLILVAKPFKTRVMSAEIRLSDLCPWQEAVVEFGSIIHVHRNMTKRNSKL